MSELVMVSPWRSAHLVGRGVILELLRRKDLYVLATFMLLFVLGVGVARIVGIENAATATFLLNLGLMMASFSAHVLTLLLTARQIPDELDNRTLYPLLAKPLERRHLLAGKWGAATLSGILVYGCLFLMAWGFTPKMDSYHPVLLLQLLMLQAVSLGMLAALALCGSIFLPRAVNLVLLGTVLFGGDGIVGLIRTQLGKAGERWIDLLLGYVPQFGRLNLTVRYTDGMGPLAAGEFAAAVACALLFAAFFLQLASWQFERRSL